MRCRRALTRASPHSHFPRMPTLATSSLAGLYPCRLEFLHLGSDKHVVDSSAMSEWRVAAIAGRCAGHQVQTMESNADLDHARSLTSSIAIAESGSLAVYIGRQSTPAIRIVEASS
jgi:hypothetical protein